MAAPNILFLFTDQQRWDALGCSGDWVRTPNIDRIASEGVRFPDCVTTSPMCVPTRISLALGLYPHTTGVWGNINTDMDPEAPTWMQAIRDAGYRTSVFGKTHLHAHVGDLRAKEHLLHAYGLDDVDEIGGPRATSWTTSHMSARWEELGLYEGYQAEFERRYTTRPWMVEPSSIPLEEYTDVYVGQQAKRYLAGYDRDQPWFCWVSFGGPHEPWDTPRPWADVYDPADMPAPIPATHADDRRPQGSLDRWGPRCSPEFEPGEQQRMRADYAGNVSLIDDQIGQVLDVIAQRGELDNTVIVFSSDHGEMNGDHGLIYKMNFFDGSVRIPLIVRTPDTVGSDLAGTVSTAPTELIDIGPTLAEAAGAELTHRHHANSLLGVLDGSYHRPDAISEFEGDVMLLNDGWKMAVNRLGEPYLLFNRADDPDEVDNLVLDPTTADVRAELSQRILARLLDSQVYRRGEVEWSTSGPVPAARPR